MAISKYTPLKTYLEKQSLELVPMGFQEIERLLGFPLPQSSRNHRAWWSNNPSNSVITHAWLNAGFETSDVDMAAEHLMFRRVRKTGIMKPVDKPVSEASQTRARRSPLFGALKGMFTLRPDVDLTRPADPEWSKLDE